MPLIHALQSNVESRVDFALAVAELADPQVIDPLIALIHQRDRRRDGEDWQQTWVFIVAGALAEFDDSRVQAFLDAAVELPDRLVVFGAMKYFSANCRPEWESVVMEALEEWVPRKVISSDATVIRQLRESANPRLKAAGERFAVTCHRDTAML